MEIGDMASRGRMRKEGSGIKDYMERLNYRRVGRVLKEV